MSSDALKHVRERIDNYVQTVAAVWAVISVVTWDSKVRRVREGRRYAVGRRMTPVTGGPDLTPDLVAQLGAGAGFLAEAKRTLPADEKRWGDALTQVARYDKPLRGWWTADETIEDHDVALLVHQSLGPRLIAYQRKLEGENRTSFRRNLCVIEFGLSEQVNQRMFVCLRQGNLRDAQCSERMEMGVMVPMERVVATYGPKSFYDSAPEPEYLMAFIWNDFVVPGRQGRTRDEKGKIEVPLSVAAMADELQRAFGAQASAPREIEYPKQAWIRRAMDCFVSLKLARRVDDDKYIVIYKEFRSDLIERFHRFRKLEAAKIKGASRRGKRSRGSSDGTPDLSPEN